MALNIELDDATRDELAGFFARRFPSAEARVRLARTAGLVLEPVDAGGTALAAWIALLARADQRGALALLADAACAAAPDDKNLAEARKLLRGAPTRPAGGGGRAVILLGAALVLLIVGAGATGAVWMMGEGDEVEVEVTAAKEPPVKRPVAAVAEPVAAVEPPPVVEAHPAALAPTRIPRRTGATSCEGTPGEIVGWWYAGTTSPGAQGATISLPSSVNVRDDYPRRDNGYALRGRVLCSLSVGTSQRLSNAPVDIGQGQWWVPLAGGDL
ncbi:MAG: hypothetical protein Q8P18_11705 [Pseudomonadota bacterium]|nr:hypothetical protein [Pseudomonadota bacterium]